VSGLFPGFSTAVLQTGPPTLGVRFNVAFWDPINKLSSAGVADYFPGMWSSGFVNDFPIMILMYA
jgi:hypothetical protein